MEVLRPGVHFEEKPSPRMYVTAFTVIIEDKHNRTFILFNSRTDVLKSDDGYIDNVLSSEVS